MFVLEEACFKTGTKVVPKHSVLNFIIHNGKKTRNGEIGYHNPLAERYRLVLKRYVFLQACAIQPEEFKNIDLYKDTKEEMKTG
jgi:hypothetical protein